MTAAAPAVQRLIQYGDSVDDTQQIFTAINRLVAAGDGATAMELWRALIARQWVKADAATVNNPMFARDPLPVSFDWSLPDNDGVSSVAGPAGLETELSGREPEECTIAEQAVVLSPGPYSLKFTYRTSGISPGTGLKWQIIDAAMVKPLAESTDLSSESSKGETVAFSVPQNASLLRIRFVYKRPLGTVRVSGRVMVASVQIESGRK